LLVSDEFAEAMLVTLRALTSIAVRVMLALPDRRPDDGELIRALGDGLVEAERLHAETVSADKDDGHMKEDADVG